MSGDKIRALKSIVRSARPRQVSTVSDRAVTRGRRLRFTLIGIVLPLPLEIL